jgi:hypothetical protein
VSLPVARAASKSSARLVGSTEPRLWTPPLRRLTRATSRGYEANDFADAIGEPSLPWQRWLNVHALELNRDGTYRFRVVLVLCARQNGKSKAKRTVSLWRLYLDGARLVLGVAQDVSLAREQWSMAIESIQSCPDLAAELDTVRRVNGDEWFRLAGGGRYKIAAANRSAGRGLSIDELNFDELREQRSWDAWSALSKTTMARASAQIWAMSNAGDDESVVLNQLREAALAGTDPSIGIFEWSAEDGCELDDPRAIAQANPGLGHLISKQAIHSARATDPPNVYRTEVLCQRVDQLDGAVDLAAWRDCGDATGSLQDLRDRVFAVLDVAPDAGHVTLAAAALTPDGRARVAIVDAWPSTTVARAALPELLQRVDPRVLGWFPTGPAAALAPVLRAHPASRELTGREVAEACQGLADLARARRVLHSADPLLDAHIAGARKLITGDGFRFVRRGAGHVDAAYAAAGAVYLALTEPPEARPRLRFIG